MACETREWKGWGQHHAVRPGVCSKPPDDLRHSYAPWSLFTFSQRQCRHLLRFSNGPTDSMETPNRRTHCVSVWCLHSAWKQDNTLLWFPDHDDHYKFMNNNGIDVICMQQLRQRLLHFLSVLKSTIESAATILQSYVVITCKWLRILPALCLISFESELKHTWPSLSEAPFCPSWWWWCTWWVPAAYLVGPGISIARP